MASSDGPARGSKQMQQFAGKVVLVTGAQQGIGRAMVSTFAEAGADVAINWLDDQNAAAGIAAQVRQSGRRAFPVHADIGALDQVRAMVTSVERELGPVDVLVNNAGVFPRVPFLDMTEGDWDFVLGVNLKGACFCAQAVAKVMIAAGRQGSIVNLTSGAAFRASPRGVHYVASKGGVLSMTRAIALELAPYRIRVNAIAPGLTDTAQPRYGSSEAELAEAARAIPLGRMAQPEEIARTALFLASDEAAFITGQTVHVNGGSYLA
jgi:NAD(P)-dependent dehydrogenase (short-subunit alcohol dehydrogenase family)